jgi:hypothetical protein
MTSEEPQNGNGNGDGNGNGEPAQPHQDERELARFIREGMKRRPEQAFGDYYHGKDASCALGAAYEAMYRLPALADGQRPTRDLDWFFDCLDTVKPCPEAGCKKRIYLAALLVHLNDDHRWSRDQIADWLTATAKPRVKA